MSRSDGVLECWSAGVLGGWSVGGMECWKPNIPALHLSALGSRSYHVCGGTPHWGQGF
jgi:hypothetical protein